MPQVLPSSRINSSTPHIFEAPASLRLWHLASLDAPTVALVWSLAFAWAAHVVLPIWVPALLVLAVWSVYVTDRLLDTRAALRNAALHRLRERHFFHWRHRRAFLPLAAAAAAASAYIIFTLMPPIARERNSILAAASLVYFTRVHTGRKLSPLLSKLVSKEFLVGVLFTAGCALPALTRITTPTAAPLWPLLTAVAFFALLAWLNCHAIDRWEAELRIPIEPISTTLKGNGLPVSERNPSERQQVPAQNFAVCKINASERQEVSGHDFSRAENAAKKTWALAPVGGTSRPPRIVRLAARIALACLLFAAIPPAATRASALLLAASAAALFLALLDRLRANVSPTTLRAAADLALLTPALLIPLAKFFK